MVTDGTNGVFHKVGRGQLTGFFGHCLVGRSIMVRKKHRFPAILKRWLSWSMTGEASNNTN
jgi:hypothetical protein